MDYRKIWNRFAYNQLTTKAPIPDARLGVGVAELRGSIPVLFYKDMSNREIVREPVPDLHRTTPYEQTGVTGEGHKIKMEDFDTDSFYLGESLGGF